MNALAKTAVILLLAAYPALGCQYSQKQYADYISSLNTLDPRVAVRYDAAGDVELRFDVRNNMVVDFPVTVTAKLISDSPILVDYGSKPEILRCKLQYRILPAGKWVTVKDYDVPTGTIAATNAPTTYFGRNNVWPQGCKAGDVVMIRMYVTDGNFQSGELDDMCEDKLGVGKSSTFPQKYTLPDTFSYQPRGRDMPDNDLGGGWLPHYAVTVIYSGHTRPLQ